MISKSTSPNRAGPSARSSDELASIRAAREVVDRRVELLRRQIRALEADLRHLDAARENADALLALSAMLMAGQGALPSTELPPPRGGISLARTALQEFVAEVLEEKAGRVGDIVARLESRGVEVTADDVKELLRSSPARFAAAPTGRGWWILASKEASASSE